MANKKKMTMVEKFEAVEALLRGEKPAVEFSVTEALEFIANRKEQTIKKNASGSKAERKPTATQIENAGIKEQIIGVLTEAGRAMNATEVAKAVGIDSNHKVSALLTQLKNAEIVERSEVKGRAVFSIATPSAEG